MKKLLLSFLIFSIVSCGGIPVSELEGGCRLKQNEIDEFTGDHRKSTEKRVISRWGGGKSITIQFRKINHNTFLDLTLVLSEIYTLREGDKIMFKTINGEVIEIPFQESLIANPTLSGLSSTNWYSSTTFNLDSESINKLKNKELEKIRIYTTSGFIDAEVKSRYKNDLAELLTCIEYDHSIE